MSWVIGILVVVGILALVIAAISSNGGGSSLEAMLFTIVGAACLLLAVVAALARWAISAILAIEWSGSMDWLHIFAVSGLAFWILTGVEVLACLGLVWRKQGVGFLLSLVIYFGLLQFMGNTPVLQTLAANWQWVIVAIVGWFVAGIVWFIMRWDWATRKMRGRYNDVLGSWLERNSARLGLPGVTKLPDGPDYTAAEMKLFLEWDEHRSRGLSDEYGEVEFRPRYRDHKDEILTWMSAWLIDAILFVVTEVLHDFWMMIYYQFQGLLQKIMERNWRGTESHVLTEQQRTEFRRRAAEGRDLPAS